MHEIIILSGVVQSGKTTSLLNYFSKLIKVGGFICPDFNGTRMMYFPSEKRLVPFQIPNNNNAVSIGKFNFDQSIFEKACSVIESPELLENDYVIIDEVGPLELKQQGYYESLKLLLNAPNQKSFTKIIIVVREHLVDDVISKFNLQTERIISKEDLKNNDKLSVNLSGVILSGGESSRMKMDKCLLKYEGVEQYKRLQKIFSELELTASLSCNELQFSNDSIVINKIVDNNLYKDAGPLTGILSAYDQLQSDLLIVGCDYPLLTKEHLQLLKQFSFYGFDEIAFVKNDRKDIVEPLICYLSVQSLKRLKTFYLEGGRSLNKYLQQVNPLKIQLGDDSFLRSFDTPEDYHSYSNQ